MTALEVTEAQVIAFAKESARGSGKCLGFANNDVVGHFGKVGALPTTATNAANQLESAGQLFTTACPDYPHVDFYDYVSKGVNLGHVDWHFSQLGEHLADSSRITTKLNHNGTVGTYANWGVRRAWAKVPALGADVRIINNPVPPVPHPKPAPVKPVPQTVGHNWETNPPSEEVQKRIQVALAKRGRYQGPENGIFGENTWRGIQYTVSTKNHNTYIGLINGIPGKLTCVAIQEYAKRYGGYTGPINAILGEHSWEGFAKGLEKGL